MWKTTFPKAKWYLFLLSSSLACLQCEKMSAAGLPRKTIVRTGREGRRCLRFAPARLQRAGLWVYLSLQEEWENYTMGKEQGMK